MKGLELSKLEENTVYQDLLSSYKVLIISKETHVYELKSNLTKNETIFIPHVYGQMFNFVTGNVQTVMIFNNQLKSI